MFYVGQEVVCVNNKPDNKYLPAQLSVDDFIDNMDGLKKGAIYTIRGISYLYGADLLHLKEIVRPLDPDGKEVGYHHDRFRPLQKKQTDISELKALLNPINHKQLEDA